MDNRSQVRDNSEVGAVADDVLERLSWDDLKYFLAIVEAGSINQAAQRLGVGQATVSRRLSELEAVVGHALFVRSVAGVTLTSLGEHLALPVRRMAEWANEVSRAAGRADARLAGVVRITAAPLVCTTILTQFAARLRSVQPGIQLEIRSSVRYLDLARGEADIAVRSVSERHGDLTSVLRISHANHVYVSARLAKQLGPRPKLTDIPWLAWSPDFDHMPPNPQLRALIPGFRPVFTADNFLVLVNAAEAGIGAIALAEPIVTLLHKSDLVPLEIPLGDYQTSETHVVAAPSALRLPKVRAVADELVAHLKELT